MSLPDGVTTCTLTYDGNIDTFGGVADSISVEVKADRVLVHAASGKTLFNRPFTATAPTGGIVSLLMPHTDQAGFRDVQGNSFTGWTYTATITARFGNEAFVQTKTFQVPTGQTTVDLDLLPSPGMVQPGVTAPTATVTSVQGRTGAVDLTDTFVPRWRPNTPYIAGALVVNPMGQTVSRKADGTSGSTYEPTNWTVITAGAVPLVLSSITFTPEQFGAKGDARQIKVNVPSGDKTRVEAAAGTFKPSDDGAVVMASLSSSTDQFIYGTLTYVNSGLMICSNPAPVGGGNCDAMIGHDDTAAWQAAIDAAWAVNGRVEPQSPGYLIDGAVRTDRQGRAQIAFPTTPGRIQIEAPAARPFTVYSTAHGNIYTTWNATHGVPSVFGGITREKASDNTFKVNAVVEMVACSIILPPNPTITAVDCRIIAVLRRRGLASIFGLGARTVAGGPMWEPTYPWAAGTLYPEESNYEFSVQDGDCIFGTYLGTHLTEHTETRQVTIVSTKIAAAPAPSNHLAFGRHLSVAWSSYMLAPWDPAVGLADGNAGNLSIALHATLDIEDAPLSNDIEPWRKTVAHLYDPGAKMYGSVDFLRIKGAVGPARGITKIGGGFVTTRDVRNSMEGYLPRQFRGDDFNRANAATLGTATDGVPWVEMSPGWTINNNQARATTAGAKSSHSTGGLPVGQHVFGFDASTQGGNFLAYYFRYVDANNWVALLINGGTTTIGKLVNGTFTNLGVGAGGSGTIVLSDTGSQIYFRKDGQAIAPINEAAFATASGIVIESQAVGGIIDNLSLSTRNPTPDA